MELHYLQHHEIDRAKWDACIARACNPSVYAMSWYLDIAAERWDAIVNQDYRHVFPLPVREKWGFCYYYPPFFIQQLGLFGVAEQFVDVLHEAFRLIEKKVRYAELQVNPNSCTDLNGWQKTWRINLLLPMDSPYEQISGNYDRHLKRNLKKAARQGLLISNAIVADELISLFRQIKGGDVPELTGPDYQRLARIIDEACQRKAGWIGGVKDGNGDLLAAGFFLDAFHRIVNLFPVVSAEGREKGAMPFLIDHIIRQYAGKGYILDFEGSEIPGVARFYRQFGAEDSPYCKMVFNRLPLPIRWLKK